MSTPSFGGGQFGGQQFGGEGGASPTPPPPQPGVGFYVGKLLRDVLNIPYIVKASQPGGVGTPVTDPVQAPDPKPGGGYDQGRTPLFEKTGLFTAGCGHTIRCWDIRQAYDPTLGKLMKLITCPICTYCVSERDPAEVYDGNRIVVG